MSARQKPANEFDWLESLPLAALLIDAKLSAVHANSLGGSLLHTDFSKNEILRDALLRALEEGRSTRLADCALNNGAAWVSPCGPQALLLLDRAEASERGGDYTQLSSTMAAMLAHEIRNPLLAIKGAAQLLGEAVHGDDAALPKLIEREVGRVEGLLATLDPLSPAPAQRFTAINIHAALEQARQSAAAFAPKVSFITDYDPSLPPVLGEQEALVQLALNLLRNAAEALNATPEPVVTITTRYSGETRRNAVGTTLPVALTISDNGPGVASEISGHLFAPFATTKPGGRGLGLAIAARITEAHGGLIGVKSQPGGGARFTLYLPIA